MKWTYDLPTKEWWYWRRMPGQKRATPVQIVYCEDEGRLECYHLNDYDTLTPAEYQWSDQPIQKPIEVS